MIRYLLHKLTRNRRVRVIRINDNPYMYRYFVGRIGPLTFYLHRFVRADAERWVHNHPWRHCLALVLCGGYWEERLDGMHPPRPDPQPAIRGRLAPSQPHRPHGLPSHHRAEGGHLDAVHARAPHPRLGFLETMTTADGRTSTGAILYHQPINTSGVRGWTKTAPRAKEVPGA